MSAARAAALTDMTLDTSISDESKAEAELDATMIWFLVLAVVLWLFALALRIEEAGRQEGMARAGRQDPDR